MLAYEVGLPAAPFEYSGGERVERSSEWRSDAFDAVARAWTVHGVRRPGFEHNMQIAVMV